MDKMKKEQKVADAPVPAKQPDAPKVEVNVNEADKKLPTQDDILPGVPNQHPPQAGPTARIDGDPNKPGEKL